MQLNMFVPPVGDYAVPVQLFLERDTSSRLHRFKQGIPQHNTVDGGRLGIAAKFGQVQQCFESRVANRGCRVACIRRLAKLGEKCGSDVAGQARLESGLSRLAEANLIALSFGVSGIALVDSNLDTIIH
jgi:hypothetical protein